MALELGKIARPQRPDRQPLFERVQEFVFRMDVGSGGFFRIGMFFLLVMFIILLYTGTQFYGLRDPEAMDVGQLGRNLWRGDGYVTKNLRPVDLWYLQQRGARPLSDGQTAVPELWTPPGYPLVLAAVFRVIRPSFEIAAGFRALKADRLLMVVSWLWFLAGLALVYALAYEMFDRHVAMLAGFLYLFCDPLLDLAISGLPMNFLTVLFLLAVYSLYKAEQWQAAGRRDRWVNGALAVAAVTAGYGTLTAYPFAALLVPLLVYVVVSFPRYRYARLAMVLILYGLVLAPWVARNWRVADTPCSDWFGTNWSKVRARRPSTRSNRPSCGGLTVWMSPCSSPGSTSARRC
ncbi:glycosyltransferase family 39 protein [bacterium]|nr:glycosyltransferase family 39 protein [bacterium]